MDPIKAVESGAPEQLLEVLVGTLGLIMIIFVHGTSIRFINRHFSQRWVHVSARTPHWRVNLLLAVTIAALSVAHFAETLLWALPISYTGMIPEMRDSYYFVLESYTTLGEGSVGLPDRWRLVGPIIAMSGLFTFGWTGSVLVSIMTDFNKLDRSRAARQMPEPPKEPRGPAA
jgi:hypothetical protein